MIRRTAVAGVLLVLAALLGVASTASAYWTGTGTGSGTATTGTLNPPTNVQVAVTPGLGAVTVSWMAPTTGVAPEGYYVTRIDSGGLTAPACGSSATSLIASPCTDTPLTGTYRYTVTAVHASWTAVSVESTSVTVVPDLTPPAVTVTRINGLVRTFPFLTNTPVTSIGGSCGTASGDVATVSPRIDGAPTSPTTVPCDSGTWAATLSPALTSEGAHSLSAIQSDLAGNQGTAPAQSVTLDTTRPSLLSIARVGPAAVNAGPLSWTVTYSEPVSDVTAGNFGLVPSGVTGTPSVSGVTAVGGSPSATWTVTASVAGVTGTDAGSIRLDQTGAGSVVDPAGNPLSTTSYAGQAYIYDTTRPTVVSIVRAGASATVNSLPVAWTVTFSEPVSGVSDSNLGLVLGGIGGTTPTIASVTPTGGSPSATWTVTTTSVAATGTNAGSIGLNLAAPGAIADQATNPLMTTSFAGQAYTYDTAGPTVTAVSSTLADGSYKAGTVVPVTVTFSEPVTVTGSPRLSLATGSPTATAVDYATGSGTATLVFTYLVVAGNTSADLDYVNSAALALNGGTIRDAATNAAALALAAPGGAGSLGANKNLVIDTTAPSVSVTRVNGLPVTFPYLAPATITSMGGMCGSSTGDSALVSPLIDGVPTSPATASCGGGVWTLTLSTPLSTDGVYGLSARQLDLAGNEGVAPTQSVTVNLVPATVVSVSSTLADGSYKAWTPVPVTVTFSEPVTVTGTPKLSLATGSPAGTEVAYASGSGTAALTFTYTVAPGDTSADLDCTGTGALVLNGGAIDDALGLPASLTLPAPGGPGSLGANKDLVIDTTPPVVTASIVARGGSGKVYAKGTGENGLPVTVYLCFSTTLPTVECSVSNALTTFSLPAVVGGVWQAGNSNSQGTGYWFATALQTDVAGNEGKDLATLAN